MNKISSKLLAVLLLVSGLPLLISSLININGTRQSLVEESQTTLNAIVDYKAQQIEQYLDYQENMVRLAARAPMIEESFDALAAAFTLGTNSQQYRALDASFRDYLEFFVDSSRFDDIYLIAESGDVLFSLQQRDDLGSNLVDGPYADSPLADSFGLAVSLFATNFTGYQPYAPSGGQYSAFFSVPIFRFGLPIGTLSAQIRSDALYDFSNDYTGLHQTGEVLLGKIDIDSVLLVAPLRHDPAAAFNRRISIIDEQPSPLVRAARGDAGSGAQVDYRGVEAISAWRYLPRLQWGLEVKIDRAEVLSAGQHLVEKLIFEVLISLAAVLFIAFLLSRWLSRPITRLLAATRQIAEGELDHRVAYQSADEIGELAASFNDMTEKLRLSLERAEAAAIAKTQFLTTMSHEIRTPLNGILGMAQILEETGLTAEQSDYLKTMVHSGNSLLTIINDVLDFSKLDTVTVELESIDFDLELLGKECFELILPQANEKQLEAVLDYQPDAPTCFTGDPARLRQVFLNFLGNAVKFTDAGYVRLAVSCQPRGDRSQLSIDVEDSGIGIEADKQQQLFEEFVQADQSTSRRFGGTGLGLAISKKLVDLMGGRIELQSRDGHGSRFRLVIELPLAEALTETGTSNLADVRGILFDCDCRNIEVIERQLSHVGMRVERIAAAADLVDRLRQLSLQGEPCRLVIMANRHDPDANIALARRIRVEAGFDEPRLMVAIPGGDKADASRYQHAGIDAYLNKLSSRQELRSMLIALLAKRRLDPLITHYSFRDAPPVEQQGNRMQGRILLVEDAPTNQLIVDKILTSLGLQVDIAENGREAVEAVVGADYDLIFMDCLMPVMDGYDATREIRQRESGRRTTIIALTANAAVEDIRRCEESGMDGVITKPFRKSDLVDCVSRHVIPPHMRAS